LYFSIIYSTKMVDEQSWHDLSRFIEKYNEYKINCDGIFLNREFLSIKLKMKRRLSEILTTQMKRRISATPGPPHQRLRRSILVCESYFIWCCIWMKSNNKLAVLLLKFNKLIQIQIFFLVNHLYYWW